MDSSALTYICCIFISQGVRPGVGNCIANECRKEGFHTTKQQTKRTTSTTWPARSLNALTYSSMQSTYIYLPRKKCNILTFGVCYTDVDRYQCSTLLDKFYGKSVVLRYPPHLFFTEIAGFETSSRQAAYLLKNGAPCPRDVIVRSTVLCEQENM